MICTLILFNECCTISLSHFINVVLDKLSLRQILVPFYIL